MPARRRSYPDKLMGQLTEYQEIFTASNQATLQKNFTPVQSSGGQAYFGTVLTTLSPGSGQVLSQTVQTLDNHGNLTQSLAYDYGNLTIPARTYNFSYLTGSNYTSHYIYNRLTSATVTPNGGSAITLVTNSYDDNPTPSCSGIQGLTLSSAQGLIDPNYGTSFTYRGNVTQTTGVNPTDVTCNAYDTTGILDQTVNATGLAVTVATQSETNFPLPGIVTPNANSNMATTVSSASSFAVTQVTAGNGASATTSYDSAGRPITSTIPDGAQTNYSYVYYSDSGNTSHVDTQTAAYVNPPSGAPQRWKVTTLDGFGRTIQVDSGYGTVSLANTVSRVLTQYAPCACSPLLKMSQVSLPFNPNSGSAVWTVYQYDASGRITAVIAPDGVSTTNYTYAGNSTTVTDPAGKWKIQTKDSFGNLTLVTEPNPAGGANLTTNYTYSPLNQLLTVSMARGGTTQTRTFTYNGQDMVSATNPENGTVTFAYDASHRVLTRTAPRTSRRNTPTTPWDS